MFTVNLIHALANGQCATIIINNGQSKWHPMFRLINCTDHGNMHFIMPSEHTHTKHSEVIIPHFSYKVAILVGSCGFKMQLLESIDAVDADYDEMLLFNQYKPYRLYEKTKNDETVPSQVID